MSQRRAMVGIAMAATTLGLGACGFQSPAVTNHEHNSVQAAEFSTGPVRVRDAYIATELGSTGEKNYLVVTFVNTSGNRESLTGVTSTGATVSLSGQGVFNGTLSIPPKGAPISIEQPLANPAGPTAELTTASPASPGTYVPMQFSFGAAGTSGTVQVPVVPATETTAVSSPVPQTTASVPPIEGERASD